MSETNEKSEEQQPGGVFINGKAQVIEMLQYMKDDEKERLLQNIKARNPSLADELMEQSFTFAHINNLTDHDLKILTGHIQASVLGIALKNQGQSFQRRVLSLAPRENAEQAYDVMIKSINNEGEMIKKAQNKIIGILRDLSKRQQVNITQ